jgi:hypothetical protein
MALIFSSTPVHPVGGGESFCWADTESDLLTSDQPLDGALTGEIFVPRGGVSTVVIEGIARCKAAPGNPRTFAYSYLSYAQDCRL